MDKNNNLKRLVSSNDILGINPHNVLWLARIKTIWQLLNIAKLEELEWINKDKILNSDTIILSRYILEKIKDILWYNPVEIKEKPILSITMKIWKKLIENNSIENFIIWNFIQKISYQINAIHLRYEKFKKYKQNIELLNNSNIDHLTWLLNRRSMDLYLKDIIINKKRNWENYWIIIIDIDFFKRINDTYWHKIWDIVLEEISKYFIEFFREEDKICRWWWEEFLIIMKWWNKELYIQKLNSLRIQIEEKIVKLVNKKIKSWCKCKDNDYCCKNKIDLNTKITISIWISSLELNDDTNNVFNRADNWLYLAKKIEEIELNIFKIKLYNKIIKCL